MEPIDFPHKSGYALLSVIKDWVYARVLSRQEAIQLLDIIDVAEKNLNFRRAQMMELRKTPVSERSNTVLQTIREAERRFERAAEHFAYCAQARELLLDYISASRSSRHG